MKVFVSDSSIWVAADSGDEREKSGNDENEWHENEWNLKCSSFLSPHSLHFSLSSSSSVNILERSARGAMRRVSEMDNDKVYSFFSIIFIFINDFLHSIRSHPFHAVQTLPSCFNCSALSLFFDSPFWDFQLKASLTNRENEIKRKKLED